MIYQKGSSQYLQILVEDKLGVPISGLNPSDVTVRVIRDLDGFYLDSVSNTFIDSGGNPEHDTSEFMSLGIYRFLFDQSLDTSDNTTYTIIYSVTQPFVTREISTITFMDSDLENIKGTGWESATIKPTLMNLANKDTNFTYDNTKHSLEKQSEDQTLGAGENFNSEPF